MLLLHVDLNLCFMYGFPPFTSDCVGVVPLCIGLLLSSIIITGRSNHNFLLTGMLSQNRCFEALCRQNLSHYGRAMAI